MPAQMNTAANPRHLLKMDVAKKAKYSILTNALRRVGVTAAAPSAAVRFCTGRKRGGATSAAAS